MRDGEFNVLDPTFSSRVFPGCGRVYFKRAAMEDLFEVDLRIKGKINLLILSFLQ